MKDYTLLQRRTSNSKQWVSLVTHDGQREVRKGPYTKEKMELIVKRCTQLQKWKAQHVLYPDRWEEEKGGWFQYTHCLFSGPVTYSDWETENFGKRVRYRLVQTEEIRHLGQFQPTEGLDLTQLVRTWILLYFLQVGDTCMRNVFVTENNAYHHDFDETSKADMDDALFFLYHKPKFDPFHDELRRHYRDVIPLLPKHPRRKQAVALLERYYSTIRPGTWFTARSSTNHKVPVLISALQKYIRRSWAYKAMQVLEELLELGRYQKAIYTGLCNRLLVIAVEDVTLANPELVERILKQITPNASVKRLREAVWDLALSPKSRIFSEIAYGYGGKEGRKKLKLPKLPELDPLEGLHKYRYSYDFCWYLAKLVPAMEVWDLVEKDPLNELLRKQYVRCKKSFPEARNFFMYAYFREWWHFIYPRLEPCEDQTPVEQRGLRLQILETWVHDQHTHATTDKTVFYAEGSQVYHQDPSYITPAKAAYHQRER